MIINVAMHGLAKTKLKYNIKVEVECNCHGWIDQTQMLQLQLECVYVYVNVLPKTLRIRRVLYGTSEIFQKFHLNHWDIQFGTLQKSTFSDCFM